MLFWCWYDANNLGHECSGNLSPGIRTRCIAGKATTLVIAFDSLWLREVCENREKADAELGSTVARALRNRLADLDAANSAADLVAGSPRVIKDGELEYMAVNLQEGLRIEFTANHVRNPADDPDHIDWANVSRIKIVGIRHGN